MLNLAFAVLSVTRSISLSGASLDATASGGTATSPGATVVNVPVANSGQIRITWVDVGTVLFAQCNKNGAGFSNFSDGDTITFADGNSILLRTTGLNVGESRTYTLTDATTGKAIATVFHPGG